MFECGLVSVTFRRLGPKEIVRLCKECSLPLIEWGSDIHAPCNDCQRLSEIVSLQKESGIACSSYGTYFRLGVHGTDGLAQYVTAAKKLGTDVLRLWCGNKNFEDMSRLEREFILSEAKKAARIAEDNGVTLCMERHGKTFTSCLEGALLLMEEVGSPNFRTYWQPDQFKGVEDNLEYARRIAKYTRIIHVFNWEGKNKYPLAKAADTWRRYLSCFDGSQKLLLEFMPDEKAESLPEEASALRRIIL